MRYPREYDAELETVKAPGVKVRDRGRNWEPRFIHLGRQLSPGGLELHTRQANQAARCLYERHGFKVVQFGNSPPPESAPDVEYHWRPKQLEPVRKHKYANEYK